MRASQSGFARAAAAVPVALWRIRAVIPCHNRHTDLSLLLSDLAALDLGPRGRLDLNILVVDNASDAPLDEILTPVPSLNIDHLRLPRNSGGSGGFNAGIRRILSRGIPGDATELVWLLDSDARVEPGALLPLITALESDPTLVAAGSALVDPVDGEVFEAGGSVDPATGEYDQTLPPGWDDKSVLRVQYLAACSLLVRRTAVERAGPLADLFLNGDDVEWCLRLARRTGGWVGAVPASRVIHPRPDRMRTGARYYAARNAFTAIAAAGGGIRARFGRALREVGRAAAQTLMGRDDLAGLHLRGLSDAAAGVGGPAPAGVIQFEAWRGDAELAGALRQVLAVGAPRGRVMIRKGLIPDTREVARTLNAVCVEPVVINEEPVGLANGAFRVVRRLVLGPPWGVAVVSARGRPGDWLAGRVVVTVAPEGFVVRRLGRGERAARLLSVLGRGAWLAVRLALWGSPALAESTALEAESQSTAAAGPDSPARLLLQRPTLSVVILSHNRWGSLERTLDRLSADPALAGAQVIVADNASADGTPDKLRDQFPGIEVLALTENRGVAGFNQGAARAAGDVLLILDDDAWPEPGTLDAALGLLAARPWIAAVALHPRHPDGGRSEWPFAAAARPTEDWPVMGCGNLVRRAAWERVGGYEESYFLYRNDVDLALKLLGAGYGVYFDPAWTVWHDSPAAARKPPRWLELATRNWVWLCRRHGRGRGRAAAMVLGWAHAHRLAGLSAGRQWKVLRGVAAGLISRPPAVPAPSDGRGLRALLRLRLRRKERLYGGAGETNIPSIPRHSP